MGYERLGWVGLLLKHNARIRLCEHEISQCEDENDAFMRVSNHIGGAQPPIAQSPVIKV